MICAPCKKAGWSLSYLLSRELRLDAYWRTYLRELHGSCKSPVDCPCQHGIKPCRGKSD